MHIRLNKPRKSILVRIHPFQSQDLIKTHLAQRSYSLDDLHNGANAGEY